MNYYARMSWMLACVGAAALVACGSDDGSANDTLPPIITTTTTTTVAPTTTTIPEFYEIQAGDSLSEIAKSFNISLSELAAYNGITDPEHIEIGQTLKIPQPGETTTSTIGAETTAPSTTIVSP